MFSQNCARSKKRPRRAAVSAVIPRLPLTIRLTRLLDMHVACYTRVVITSP